MTTFTTPHSLPIIEPSLDKIAASGDGLAEDINALALAANAALQLQSSRADVAEVAVSGNGTLVVNLIPDPVPVIADTTTYTPARCTVAPVGGRGRATCTDGTGANSFWPKATIGGSTVSQRYPATAGKNVATTVTVYGHPTVAMGIVLTLQAYRWDGAAFQTASVATPFTTALTQIPAAGSVTFELFGQLPDSDVTHVLPMITFRRWGQTYPTVGDYIDWASWSIQVGGTAAQASPVPYIDGSMTDGYWLGTPNQSASRGILGGNGGSAFNAAKREMLLSAFTARRNAVIGTGGKPALALRFDHGLLNFGSKVLPLLQKYGLPWCQAVNPATIADVTNATTFATLQQWCIDNGGEVWNHGRTHNDATGRAAIRDEIETSLAELRAGLPALPIEGYIPPGVGDGGLGGASPWDTLEKFWNTFAGQLVLGNHAVATGYIPGLYRTLPADSPIGLSHATIDSQTTATVQGWVDGAIANRAGIQLMLHPSLVDTAGYVTTANVETIFAYIAAQRDAGLLEVLTPSGLLLADPTSNSRYNMITDGQLTAAALSTNWANSTGWSIVQAQGFRYATTTTGTPLTQLINTSRQELLFGSSRELVCRVRTTAGAVVRTSVTSASINSPKDHTLPASANWVEVRTPITIPLNFADGGFTAAVGRVSGGAVDITDVRLQSV